MSTFTVIITKLQALRSRKTVILYEDYYQKLTFSQLQTFPPSLHNTISKVSLISL